MTLMKALGWEHPRCVDPMIAASTSWSLQTGTTIEWTFRPLSHFNDQPTADVASEYDLIILDHPGIPSAAASGAIIALDDILPGGLATVEIASAPQPGPTDTTTERGHCPLTPLPTARPGGPTGNWTAPRVPGPSSRHTHWTTRTRPPCRSQRRTPSARC